VQTPNAAELRSLSQDKAFQEHCRYSSGMGGHSGTCLSKVQDLYPQGHMALSSGLSRMTLTASQLAVGSVQVLCNQPV
jgi:hypothetical protein